MTCLESRAPGALGLGGFVQTWCLPSNVVDPDMIVGNSRLACLKTYPIVRCVGVRHSLKKALLPKVYEEHSLHQSSYSGDKISQLYYV